MPPGRRRGLHAAICLTALLLPGLCGAAMSIYVPPEELALRATLVVEGRVTRTASGYDPRLATLGTYVEIEIATVHRGPTQLRRIVIREPGGRFGELAHEVDAVPTYVPGERVLVFLEPAPDGALRTLGMFFGKFVVDESDSRGPLLARRELGGRGRILRGPAGPTETIPVADLVSLTHSSRATRPAGARVEGWAALPPESARLLWDEVRRLPAAPAEGVAQGSAVSDLALRPSENLARARWETLSATSPTRWFEPDSGSAVTVHLQRAGNPLGNDLAALDPMRRAAGAWSGVPESRIELRLGNDDYDYTASHAVSPAASHTGVNVILFDDPFGDISDPVGCSGVLAIGGYWRSAATAGPVNNVAFHPALQLYVIFNNDFECFLGDPDNLAEVAAHELGHGLGFGHSDAPDALMRSSAHGNRGPRLGDDDRDAAHCHYPHALTVSAPNGGEVWTAGELRTIAWEASEEPGSNPGEVDLDYSTDAGSTWRPIVSGTTNDGNHEWVVPAEISSSVRVRVIRGNRAGATPPPFPAACSLDGSDADFHILAPPIVAGTTPADPAHGGLRIERHSGGELRLSWGASCSPDVDNHVVYEGSLSALRSGDWEHRPAVCDAGADLVEYVAANAGDRYYLVAPSAASHEGHLGRSRMANSGLRPAAAEACFPREESSVCK